MATLSTDQPSVFQLPAVERSLGGGQESVQKGASAMQLANALQAFRFNNRNTERLLQKHERDDGVKPAEAEPEMRIDSDDIHQHYHMQPQAQASGMGSLAKIATAGLMATGVGAPLGIAAWNLPEIIKAFNPPAVTQPAFDPNDFDLMVGPPKETPQ